MLFSLLKIRTIHGSGTPRYLYLVKPRLLPLLLLLLLFHRAAAYGYTFDYNAACAAAYRAYLSLHTEEGDALIRAELITHPYNITATYIADYGDAVTLLFNGDPYQLEQRKGHEEERLQRVSRGSDDAPWKRLAQAGIQLHWALIRLRRGEQLKAAAGLRRSYFLLKENARLFPQFRPDDVLYGAEETLAGIIPDSYKWLGSMLGVKGNLNDGLNMLSAYVRQHTDPASPLLDEAILYSAFLRFNFGGAKAAVWQEISSNTAFPIQGNPMRAFFRANLALAFRKADVAVSTLQAAELSAAAHYWPVMDFELGSALLLRLDPSCLIYFDRYIARNASGLYTKDALQQAALGAYLNGDAVRAHAYRARIAAEGSLNTDADRQAQRFGAGDKWPQPLLLTARLLIDGGYAGQALGKLGSSRTAAFPDMADKLEYDFRLGRALEETGDAAAAVQAYQRVINAGRERPEHFAARSALQIAGIYEARGQKAEAGRYYRIALSMHNHDYQASIDQLAKAGLSRVSDGN